MPINFELVFKFYLDFVFHFFVKNINCLYSQPTQGYEFYVGEVLVGNIFVSFDDEDTVCDVLLF